MLSSIHPLGERSRNNRWPVTIGAFTLGALTAAGLIGAVLGFLGSHVDVPSPATAAIVLGAGVLDLLNIAAPGPKRQVNERWIDMFRGVIYGAGFGAQLGAGVATFVVSWGVYAVFFIEFAAGSTVRGAGIGLMFGFARSLLPLASGWVDRPSRLTTVHRRLADLARPMHLVTGAVMVTLGAVLAIGA